MVASTTYLVRCFGSLQTNENKKLSSITPKKPKRKRKTFQLESILEKKKHSSIPKTSHLHRRFSCNLTANTSLSLFFLTLFFFSRVLYKHILFTRLNIKSCSHYIFHKKIMPCFQDFLFMLFSLWFGATVTVFLFRWNLRSEQKVEDFSFMLNS